MTEELKNTLEDKENEVRHAKEAAVLEYRDSDALLVELKVSYNDGFDDALRQAKALLAFIGSFAHYLAGGIALEAALTEATRYSAFSVTRHGAQKSYPTEAEFAAFKAEIG